MKEDEYDEGLSEEEIESIVDSFVEMFHAALAEYSPEKIIATYNLKRVRDVQFVAKTLRELMPSCTVEISDIDMQYGVCYVSVVGDSLEVENTKKFSDLSNYVDNIEMYPLNGGKTRMSFGLFKMVKPIE